MMIRLRSAGLACIMKNIKQIHNLNNNALVIILNNFLRFYHFIEICGTVHLNAQLVKNSYFQFTQKPFFWSLFVGIANRFMREYFLFDYDKNTPNNVNDGYGLAFVLKIN